MRVVAAILLVLGFFVCLGTLGIQTTQPAPADSSLGSLAVVSFEGQHEALMTLLTGGLMWLSGCVLWCGSDIISLLRQLRDR